MRRAAASLGRQQPARLDEQHRPCHRGGSAGTASAAHLERSRRLRWTMKFRHFEFGAIEIDGVTYEHDLVVDRGKIHQRDKKASRKFRDTYGHTPLSLKENIPWKCS